jgi:hypothetical protein
MCLTLLVHFRMHDLRCIIRTSGANYTSSMTARKAGVFTQMNILWDAFGVPLYTDEHLNWDTPPLDECLLIDLSVTFALSHLVGRYSASHFKCSRV